MDTVSLSRRLAGSAGLFFPLFAQAAAKENPPSIFCSSLIGQCNLMSEWGVMWQAASVVITAVVGAFGIYKIWKELKRLNEQREKEAADKATAALLKRVEFFLAQHRRLFDNAELYEVLCLVDADHEKLADPKMADKKRKFATFIEEIALLVNTHQINKEVAYYMFGYYAGAARFGTNFAADFDFTAEHWGLLFKFADEAGEYSVNHPDGPGNLCL